MVVNARDRTIEFFSTANQLRQSSVAGADQNGSAPFYAPSAKQHRVNEQRELLASSASSKVARVAGSIAEGIQNTAGKLETLAKLVKSKSMYNDQSQQIHNLSNDIKGDIKHLNEQIDGLSRFNNSSKFNSAQSSDHSQAIVKELRRDLQHATKGFQEALQTRTNVLKSQNSRRTSRPPGSSRARHRKPGELARRIEMQDEESVALLEGADGTSNGMMTQAAPQQQQQVVAQQRDDYYEQRAESMRDIESTIAELGQMYQQLGTIVQEQGEIAIRINENVMETEANTTEGLHQLEKYYQSIRGNRTLILKVFAILLLFICVGIAFF